MADDPNRDILPVKEGCCADTILSAIDPRERHLVCKLDRYQLEDRYLRLLDEANNLKKLSNCQEDKIKRLGTKLIRLAGNPRSCGLALDIVDDKSRMSALELENTKLKEKVAVMRNQLLSHTMSGRSSSRSRNLARPATSSGLMTCRSENTRARVPSCQCIVEAGHADDSDARNYLVKIERLEAQKKDMACRVAELEKELALYTTNSQREKVAENVEYIRVWRQMKQLNDKLIAAQDKNAALTTEINDLKTTLEQTTRNNQQIAAVLTSERTRIAEIDDQILKAKNSQLTLREKDEQIRDLMSEIKILQQHNNELIALTSKYGQVELENIELRKKLSEHMYEQQTLKTAFNNEQANIVTLQATNEQLLAKLQELQANIDTLTVQLASLRNEKHDATTTMPLNMSKNTATDKPLLDFDKPSAILIEQCKKYCAMYDKVTQLEKIVAQEDWQSANKSVQTVTVVPDMREQGTMTIPEDEEKECSRLHSPSKEWQANQEANGTGVLSREKILKLLDQAQINTPLDASRLKEEYTGVLDVAQRHSDEEVSSRMLHDELRIMRNSSRRKLASLENLDMTSSQILRILFDVLQKYLSFSKDEGRESSNHQVPKIEESIIDDNNNNLTAETARILSGHDIKQNNSATISPNDDKYAAVISGNRDCVTEIANTNDYIQEDAKMNYCTCIDAKNCHPNPESGCCTDNSISRSITVCVDDCGKPIAREEESTPVSMRDIASSTKRAFYITPLPTIYEKYRKSPYRDISDDFCAEKIVKKQKTQATQLRHPRCNLTCHLRKAKDRLAEREKQKFFCKIQCLKDRVDPSVCPAESFPLLITNRQGLIEIHISRLQLSTSAAKIPEEEDICDLRIYISWDIWNNKKTAYTPRMKCPNLNFNSSSVYRIADLFSFFKNVLSEYLVFRVNVVRHNDTSYTLAQARVSIKDILDYPQNKLHYIVPVSSVIACTSGVNFGQLSLWVRLSCNVDMVEAFKKQCGIASLSDALHAPHAVEEAAKDAPGTVVGIPTLDDAATPVDRDSPSSAVPEISNDRHVVPSSDLNQYENEDSNEGENDYDDSNNQENSLLINEMNNMFEEENEGTFVKRKYPDSEAQADNGSWRKKNDTPAESSSMMNFKNLLTNAGSDVSMLGASSSTIRDMGEVLLEKNWARYKQKSLLMSFARAKPLSTDAQDQQRCDLDTCQLEKDTIVIEIVCIVLFEESFVMQNDEIHLLFVEYSFLEHHGEDMETVSVEKPKRAKQKMMYNFRKEFRIDKKTHSVERNNLCAMLSESASPYIKFFVVSEPLPEETEIKDCIDVGCALFDIREYAHSDGRKNILLPIKDDRNKQIGVLEINILGFDAIRECLMNDDA